MFTRMPTNQWLMQRAGDDRERDDEQALGGRFWWPFERGNREFACALKRWVGKYAS